MDFKRKISADKLGKVLVLGAGVTGSAVADYLQTQGQRVESFDVVDEDSLDVTKHYDFCIASPGISEFSEFYAKAKSCSEEVISEVEFAFRESEANSTWFAINGTNGKTNTTVLT
ncbi:MAG: UDP-N-acetylmuramoyl-L-alanine--D-glutamate ligase, partial [Phoenicibacter congonensis]|nr:UDP-N-acetylmuramoyl-L-alanine--D-glutamate ligase [Phoenicibacter congonensis]